MSYSYRILKNFRKLSVLKQSCLIVMAAVVGAETLTLIFYSIFFADRLLLDLFLTGVIVVVVGFPLAIFLMDQQRKLAEMAAQLQEVARTDGLTGLMNRETFFAEAGRQVADGGQGTGALLFIDVDHFKSVNDTLGHAAGDKVLREIARILKTTIGAEDLAARLGGEEFAILLTAADQEAALEVADSVRTNVRAALGNVYVLDRPITVSIGLSPCAAGLQLEDLLLNADRNLYAAKRLGRDLVVHDGLAPAMARKTAETAERKQHSLGAA